MRKDFNLLLDVSQIKPINARERTDTLAQRVTF